MHKSCSPYSHLTQALILAQPLTLNVMSRHICAVIKFQQYQWQEVVSIHEFDDSWSLKQYTLITKFINHSNYLTPQYDSDCSFSNIQPPVSPHISTLEHTISAHYFMYLIPWLYLVPLQSGTIGYLYHLIDANHGLYRIDDLCHLIHTGALIQYITLPSRRTGPPE